MSISRVAKLLILDELRCGGVGRWVGKLMGVSGVVSRLNEASLISPSCSKVTGLHPKRGSSLNVHIKN
jgi:hypothetical protein